MGVCIRANSKGTRRKSRCMPRRISAAPKTACLVSRKKHASPDGTSRINISAEKEEEIKEREKAGAARVLDYRSEIFPRRSLLIARAAPTTLLSTPGLIDGVLCNMFKSEIARSDSLKRPQYRHVFHLHILVFRGSFDFVDFVLYAIIFIFLFFSSGKRTIYIQISEEINYSKAEYLVGKYFSARKTSPEFCSIIKNIANLRELSMSSLLHASEINPFRNEERQEIFQFGMNYIRRD